MILTERSIGIILVTGGPLLNRMRGSFPATRVGAADNSAQAHMRKKEKPGAVHTQIKNQELVASRRRQLIDAAARLFVKNGFHRTTTRQIASAAGMPIGSMYEYVSTKEDILYLVCDAIHAEVEKGVAEAMARASRGKNILADAIREYFLVCDLMSDHILLIYQETRTLPKQWRGRVLDNEVRITGIFTSLIRGLVESGELPGIDDGAIEVAAHNIAVLGHMWTFRRWFFGRRYRIMEYTRLQTEFILGMLKRPTKQGRTKTKETAGTKTLEPPRPPRGGPRNRD